LKLDSGPSRSKDVIEANARANILFLDACRSNPLARNLARAFGTRLASIGMGLAPPESSVGRLMSFPTQPGNVAINRIGRNSPFAGALVRHIQTTAESLGDMLIEVRNDVRKENETGSLGTLGVDWRSTLQSWRLRRCPRHRPRPCPRRRNRTEASRSAYVGLRRRRPSDLHRSRRTKGTVGGAVIEKAISEGLHHGGKL
jgi:hypothetical protein